MKKDMKKVLSFELHVNHTDETVSVESLAPYSYNELNVLFCALGEILERLEKLHRKEND